MRGGGGGLISGQECRPEQAGGRAERWAAARAARAAAREGARALRPTLRCLGVGVQQRGMAALATDEQLEPLRVRARRER